MLDLVQIFRGPVFYLAWFLAILLCIFPLVQCALLVVAYFLGRNERSRKEWKTFYQGTGVTLILAGCIGIGMGATAYWIMPRMITSIEGQLGILLINLVAARVSLYLLERQKSILSDFESNRV